MYTSIWRRRNCYEIILPPQAQISHSRFDNNLMKSNADKFQGMILSRDGPVNVTFEIQNYSIKSQHNMKTLGVLIDDSLKFNDHIKNICSRASGQVNALKRLSCFLNESRRLNIYVSFLIQLYIQNTNIHLKYHLMRVS